MRWWVLCLLFLGSWVSPGLALRITATLYPLYDLAQKMAPPEVEIRLLIPPGADPHHFEPRLEALKALRRSDLVLAVGYEPWLPRNLPRKRLLLLAEGPLKNPHAWLDLERVQSFVERLARRLAVLCPERTAEIEIRKRGLLAQIQRLEGLKRGLSTCHTHTVLVLGHAALGELLKGTSLQVVSLAGPHPESEVLPGKLSQALALVRRQGLSTVFLLDPGFERYAPFFQREGARVLRVNPGLPFWPGEKGLSFLDLLRKDLLTLKKGLCETSKRAPLSKALPQAPSTSVHF